ncbi:MAG TPA: gamma-glutamyltransferase [Verrucomicrobiales bacterium]|jgi:gamma-glutamyltranspeptidase/glutathione hydrolase|nr:gamma-glutamyltransferase [Verrucomicrobiales bacterium]
MALRCLLLLLLALPLGQAAEKTGAVVTVHPLATKAAEYAFIQGGNAVDAAVAAALTLGVVDGFNSGIGGGCFMLIRKPDGTFVAIDGRETAPQKASRDMFLHDGKADPDLSRTGALAIGVPGALAAYDLAIREHGNIDLAEHLGQAAAIAEKGFALDKAYLRRLDQAVEKLRQFPDSARIFLGPDGNAWPIGHSLKQPDLARSYRKIARHPTDWFYRGPFALKTEEWMLANGGLISRADLAAYKARRREPVRSTYRGFEIVGFPPPSSGGVHVAQILNILETFDLRSMPPNSPRFVHHVAEAMRLAFADRAHWLGDADFAPVPKGLASKKYASELARRIHPDKVTNVERHSTPPDADTNLFGKHTTHFSATDSDGWWVACTATVNTTFGSGVVLPGTGIVMNNEMDDFSAQPGTPNAFGLIGAEANAVAPGKRPLSSMSPTIVLRDGKPVFTVGAAGGPTIISQAVLAIIHFIDHGMTPAKALGQARFHHQWKPNRLLVEKALGQATIDELRKMGHTVKVTDSIGAAQALGLGQAGRPFTGAADPRGRGVFSVTP